jgi:hypothetical protein
LNRLAVCRNILCITPNSAPIAADLITVVALLYPGKKDAVATASHLAGQSASIRVNLVPIIALFNTAPKIAITTTWN